MRRFIILAGVGVLLTATLTAAQYTWNHEGYRRASSDNAEVMVVGWYQRYLHRTPGNGEHIGWIQALQQGQAPETLLAGVLGSQEYFNNAGGTPEGFVEALFADLTGRKPTPAEYNSWARRLRHESPTDVAFAFLQRYPPSWGEGLYHPDEWRYDYRKPVWPYKK